MTALVAWIVGRSDEGDEVPYRVGWMALSFCALCPLALIRFDVAPALLTLLAVMAWSSGRSVQGGFWAGLGTAMKIFPGAAAVPFVASEVMRGKFRGLVAAALTVVASFGLWFAIGGAGVAQSLGYHVERGIECETLAAGWVSAYSAVMEIPTSTRYDHFSVELVAPGADVAAKITVLAQLAALGVVAFQGWRTGCREPYRLAASGVLAFLVFGKVLSPQYLLWAIPLVVPIGGHCGRDARPLLLLSCLMTTLVYPWSIDRLSVQHPRAIVFLNVRNLLLLALWFVVTFVPERPAARTDANAVRL
jgi:hypothetical protein